MTECCNSIKSVRILYEISILIQSDTKLEEKFEKALGMVKNTVGCHSASLFIHDEESGKLKEVATVGRSIDLIEKIPFDMGNGFSAWVAKQRRSVMIPNLRGKSHEGFRSFISTPLVSRDKLIGVMNLGHEEKNAFTEKHIEFLEIIAGLLAHTIERAEFEQMLVEKNDALIRAREEIEKQQQKIIEMEKYQLLGQIAVSINHEINNPLTTIIGNVELLLMMKKDMDENIRNKLTKILNESRRIADIVKKLRDMKKIAIESYIDSTGEKMIAIKSSYKSDKEENLS
ncbi:MAG: GAF domain-containing protein [Candidatus Latescibacteria bacterium]|jgi:K+-sensing histidine kinase KdpD|nr:GAF domain-containing protein [Candidatus Latescibacterota bacterium]